MIQARTGTFEWAISKIKEGKRVRRVEGITEYWFDMDKKILYGHNRSLTKPTKHLVFGSKDLVATWEIVD